MARWPDGPTARWPDGPMARRPDGPTARWPDGPTARWPVGPMARWPDGTTARRPGSLVGQRNDWIDARGPARRREAREERGERQNARHRGEHERIHGLHFVQLTRNYTSQQVRADQSNGEPHADDGGALAQHEREHVRCAAVQSHSNADLLRPLRH